MRLFTADRVRTARGIAGNAVLVDRGSVVETGWAERLRRPGILEKRLDGTLTPGLRDAHIHPVGYASSRGGLVLDGVSDMTALLTLLADADARLATGFALVASRLDEERMSERRLPTRADLDSAVSDRPVLLARVCGHIAVANTAALDAAAIGPDTVDPPGGAFDRDTDNVPNGVLRESAVRLVSSHLTPPPIDETALLETLRSLARLGLTSLGGIVDLTGGLWTPSDESEMLKRVAPDLPIRIGAFVIAPTADDLAAAASRLDAGGPRLRFAGAKEFADGSLGGHTAALHSPYADHPGTGTLRLRPTETLPRVRRALELDAMVAIHAIGDRAASHVLDVFSTLITDGTDPRRLRMEHASMLSDDDLARMADLGVTASIQPAFVPSDGPWLAARLGPKRGASTYPFATMARNGIRLAGGSDAPVESPDPLVGIAAARDRGGFTPEEALTAEQAFSLFTDDAADALGEQVPLSPDSPADFVVLDVDPVEATPDDLRRANVLSTWLEGELVV